MRDRAILPGLLALSLLSVSPFGLADGTADFQQYCSGCHGANGGGTPGLAPSLEHPELWSALGDQAPRYLVGVVSNGMSGKLSADAQGYTGMVMPPVAGIDAASLARVATHVIADINGVPTDISADDVASLQGERMSHAALKALRNGSGAGDE